MSSSRPRVAILHLGKSGAGPEIARRLAHSLHSRGQLAGIVMARSEHREAWPPGVPVLSIRTYDSALSASLGAFRFPVLMRHFHDFLRSTEADVVVTSMPALWQAPFAATAKAMGIPYVASVHDVEMHLGEKSWIAAAAVGLESRLASSFVFYSGESARLAQGLRRYRGKKRISVRHGPLVDVSSIPRAYSESDLFKIGIVGRIHQYKGVELGVDAVDELRSRGVSCSLEVWGSGDPEILERLRDRDGIELHEGWIDDDQLAEIVQRFDVLLIPYLEASQSGVVSLAQSVGLPVVVTPVGALPEQVGETSCGVIADSVDAGAIADALLTLANDAERRVSLGENGRRALLPGGIYSWDRAVDSILAEMNFARPRRLVFTVSTPETAYAFLRGQLRFLAERGYAPTLITSDDGSVSDWAKAERAQFHAVPILREPSIKQDLRALVAIFAGLVRFRPWGIVFGTPKASLLSSVSAYFARVPKRVYLVHGLRYEGLAGWRQRVLMGVEWLNCMLATHVVCVSPSVRDRLVADKLCRDDKAVVLGFGSPNGVDGQRFHTASSAAKFELRHQHQIPTDHVVTAFVGRINPDKGYPVLGALANHIGQQDRDITLVVAGPAEGGEAIRAEMDLLESSDSCRVLGPVRAVEDVYALADILILPTAREGLPTVVIEAGASGLPVVASAVTGCVDAVIPGETGTLVVSNDPVEWVKAIRGQMDDLAAGSINREGIRSSVLARFDEGVVLRGWLEFLSDL